MIMTPKQNNLQCFLLLLVLSVTAMVVFIETHWQISRAQNRGTHWQKSWAQNRSRKDTCELFPPFKIIHTELSKNITCEAKFCPTLEGNKRKIESYNFTQAEPYIRHLTRKNDREIFLKEQNSATIEIPVLVSGASRNHFREALVLFDHLNKVYHPFYSAPFYFFDLGLKPSELQKIKRVCNCTVVKFPFEKFPAHVSKLHAYCWKPLIIQIMLQENQFVMWIDTSCRFDASDLDYLFVRTKLRGLLARQENWPLVSHLHEDTFLFLQEPPCLYKNYDDWQGGLIIVHGEHELIYNYIIQTWIKCALVEECMKTKQNTGGNMLYCGKNHYKYYHSCHRYEQATLGLFLHRLFPDSFDDYHLDNYTYYHFKKM